MEWCSLLDCHAIQQEEQEIKSSKGLLCWHKYSSTIPVCLMAPKLFWYLSTQNMPNRAKVTNRTNMGQLLIGSLANQAYLFQQQFNNHDFIMFHVAFCCASLKHATSATNKMDFSCHQAGYHLS
jgi:hypothetical protein